MSSLKSLIEQLRVRVLGASGAAFEVGRSKHPVLAAYPDFAAVLVSLSDEREESYPARDALTNALLAMHRTTKSTLWSSTLAVAFFPMLSRLRHRIVGDIVPGDELDQLVLASFWAALAEVPVQGRGSDRLPMRLRQRTQRLVFQSLRRDREQEHDSLDDDVRGEELERAVSSRVEKSVCEDRVDLALLLERAALDGIPRAALEVIAATTLRSELLRNYVSRVGPTDDIERTRMYERLKRQRSRVMRRLRSLAIGRVLPN